MGSGDVWCFAGKRDMLGVTVRRVADIDAEFCEFLFNEVEGGFYHLGVVEGAVCLV